MLPGHASFDKNGLRRTITFDAAMREHNDVLGAVSSIISGYPERARYFLDAQRGMAHARRFQAYMDDYQVIHGNTEGVQTS